VIARRTRRAPRVVRVATFVVACAIGAVTLAGVAFGFVALGAERLVAAAYRLRERVRARLERLLDE
jgi:hypothetical protein